MIRTQRRRQNGGLSDPSPPSSSTGGLTETLGVAWRRPNFWVMPDLYWANLPGGSDYTLAANGFLMDRMLFATSYPAVNVEQYVTSLKSAGLTEAAWQAISADNPRRLLGMD